MTGTKQPKRADKYVESIGPWVIDWMEAYSQEYPASSDTEFFKSSLSHLQRKGYMSQKQLKIIGDVWNDCKEAWPEFHGQAFERTPFEL